MLGTESPEAHRNDVDYARWLQHGGGSVVRLDPEAAYGRGGLRGLEQAVLDKVRSHDVGILVYTLGMEFDFRPAFFREALPGVYRVLLLGDDEHYFEVSHRYYAQCFDFVLTTNPVCERYREWGVEARFLPGTFDSRFFSPGATRRKGIDVSFVGAMAGKAGRREYAEALARSGVPFTAFGAGTAQGEVSRERLIEIFRTSRINLNFTGGALRTPLDGLVAPRPIRQVKGRCSMIALCGSFVLSEHAPGIDQLFEVGTEIDVFRDERELVDKIRFYLANEALRERMARRAYERALRDYDEAVYGRKLALELAERARSARPPAATAPLRLGAEFRSAFGAWRFKYLVIFLFGAAPALFARELALLVRARRFNPYAALWFGAMGLLVAARRSRLAAALARTLRRLRRRQWQDARAHYG